MNVRVLSARELDAGLIASWREILAENTSLASPYFAPEFTQAAAEVRDDVYVAVIEDGGIAGLFPHQRRDGHGRPVGGPLSDYQGIIAQDNIVLDTLDLMHACGLRKFDFDHLLASQREFVPWHRHCEPSYFIALQQGFEAYFAAKKSARVMEMLTAPRHRRGIENELGPLRFVPHTADEAVLDRLLTWKRNQYHATHVSDAFAFPWSRELLRRILGTQGPAFSGMLSALYAGDELVAAHFGMRTPSVWHYWILAYDPAHRRYSPGGLLLLEMLRHAASLGIAAFDLGKGYAPYKERMHTGTVMLAEGTCEAPSLGLTLRNLGHQAEQWVRRSPLLPIARIPARLVRRMEKRRIYG